MYTLSNSEQAYPAEETKTEVVVAVVGVVVVTVGDPTVIGIVVPVTATDRPRSHSLDFVLSGTM